MVKTQFGIFALCTLFVGALARDKFPGDPEDPNAPVVHVTYCANSDAKTDCSALQSIKTDGCHNMPLINGRPSVSAHWQFDTPDPEKKKRACFDMFTEKECRGNKRRVQVPDNADIHGFEGFSGSINMVYPC